MSLDQLFEGQTQALRQCFELMIETWEKSIEQMAEGARVAERRGAQDLSHRLRRRAGVLEARVRLFRETFLKSGLPPV